jgi:hypothetical protein
MAHPTDENSEDVGSDEHVASSRAGKDDDSGTYAGEIGAEARSERGGQ